MQTPNAPESMQAIAIARPGGPEVLTPLTLPRPDPGPGEVLIRIAAAGVNGPDLAQRRGGYDPPPGASPLPGLEVAGHVESLGPGVAGFTPGDPVMALTNGGGYAEYVAVPAGQVLPVPRGWSLPEAAGLPETLFTLTQTLIMRAGLAPGMHVLVHGAAGGIGGMAVLLATGLGARAIALVSTPEKAAYARALGAVAAFQRTDNPDALLAAIRALTGGAGVERILDIAGGPMAAFNVRAAARGGHILQVSTLAGASAELPLRRMMMKDLTLSGSTLRPQGPATKAAIATRIRTDLLALFEDPARPRPRIARLPLEAAAEAHRRLESPGHIGKIVLETPWGRTI